MGTMNLPLSMQVAPVEIFAEMPASLKSFLQRGFADLARLPFERVETLSSLIAGGLEQSDDSTTDEVARQLDVHRDEVGKIIAALGLLIAFTTRRTDVAAVLDQGVEVGVVRKENLQALRALAQKLSEKKSDYREALEVASLSKEVAPSFERLDSVVELRFSFEGNNPSRSVPVALCYLQTDSSDNRAFFQMRKQDVQRVNDQLAKILLQMESLEKWSTNRSN